MTVGTRIDSVSGPVTSNNSAGLSVARDTGNVGFGPFKVDSVKTIVTSSTLAAGDAGVSTISGSAVLTQSMPLASACPGAEFIFRTRSAHAHVITGSAEVAGTKVFNFVLSGSGLGPTVGSKLTLGAVVGSSVVLKSDGLNFHVLSFSGSLVVSGT